MDERAPELGSVPAGELPGPSPEGHYANYFKIGHTPCEFLLEFGQLFPDNGHQPPCFHARIITSPSYAKALIATLQRSVDQFEAAFGTIPDLEDKS